MVKYGIKEVELAPEGLDTLKQLSIPIWCKLADNKYPKTLLDEVIKKFRDIKSQPE